MQPANTSGFFRLPVRGEVTYENVSFGYNPERVVLRNLSLHARPGEIVALAGPTGAGKSTLVNLLPAFYEAISGRILIDGQDISGISLQSLREHISVVSQEAFLFNGTIRENILYGRLDATEDELIAASKAANCHEFIEHLPNGYDSRVGERGVKLSVGEKQRVSIARALLKDSPILILDEATASVERIRHLIVQAPPRTAAEKAEYAQALSEALGQGNMVKRSLDRDMGVAPSSVIDRLVDRGALSTFGKGSPASIQGFDGSAPRTSRTCSAAVRASRSPRAVIRASACSAC